MPAETSKNDTLLQVRNLSKSFPGVNALQGVRLDVRRGQVHALLGENGAGKSTLMRILIGLLSADAGDVFFQGRRVQIRSPHAARQLGIAMIHQELLPFPELTVAENLFMGQEPTRWWPGWLDKPARQREATRLLQRLGVALSPATKMKRLSVAQMQTVEIAKALAHQAELIIMDEPTSAISEREVEALFGLIRDLQQRGVAVIYISHKLDEIFRIADAVTVLRDGRHVATQHIGEVDEQQLIAWMVGRELQAVFPKASAEPRDVALEVRGLTRPGEFHDVTFQVRRGEIVGIAGLMGAGRTELVHALFGLAPARSGEIRVHGRTVRIASPRAALAQGLALVSEDRQRLGLVPDLSVKQNITLASLTRCCRLGWIDHRRENLVAEERIREFAIKTPDGNQKVKYLSGGNQQKVVIAKALLTEPSILILDEPTRGIDIGAKAEIYAIMTRLAREGQAILMVSSELPEVLALSHRILVMREGLITAELDPRHTSQEEILRYAIPH
ncbi:MAG: sugar ABC transporter ATP-binding protein [Planctomycetota bacterium]|nr:sugar ABC transporter ATP-binding protein [Planctomycetota bacterium]